MANSFASTKYRQNFKFLATLTGILEGLYADVSMNKAEALFLDTWLSEQEKNIYLDGLSLELWALTKSFTEKFLVVPDEKLSNEIDDLLNDLENIQTKLDELLEKYKKVMPTAQYHFWLINHFQGICKGFTADHNFATEEIITIANWLDDVKDILKDDPLVNEFYEILDRFDLNSMTGEKAELLKISLLPLIENFGGYADDGSVDGFSLGDVFFDDVEQIDLTNKKVIFTGKFKLGSRVKCFEWVKSLGAIPVDKKEITLDIDYLIVGSFGTPAWVYQTYGRKIERAKYLQTKGYPVKIITEDQICS